MGSSSLQHYPFQRDTCTTAWKADPNIYASLLWWIDAFDKLRSENMLECCSHCCDPVEANNNPLMCEN